VCDCGDVRRAEEFKKMKYHRSQDFERVTVMLPVSDARTLKHFAVDEGRSTSAVIRSAVAEYMAKPDKQTSQHRASQRVSE